MKTSLGAFFRIAATLAGGSGEFGRISMSWNRSESGASRIAAASARFSPRGTATDGRRAVAAAKRGGVSLLPRSGTARFHGRVRRRAAFDAARKRRENRDLRPVKTFL
jgi:hypothetical protein